MALKTDDRIARQAGMRPRLEIAGDRGLPASLVEHHDARPGGMITLPGLPSAPARTDRDKDGNGIGPHE